MTDFARNMTRKFKESLTAFERQGFRYLSTDERFFLPKISDNLLMVLEQNEIPLSAQSANPKENGSVLNNRGSELVQSMRNSETTIHKPINHTNMSHENKKDCGVKKTQSSKNGQPNILQVLKQSEDEYQNFMSDDLPTKINNPKLSVNTQVPDDFKNPTYISTLEASRFCINGSPKDYTPAKKQLPPKANQPFVQTGGISPKREAALRAHR